ncbi:unnamed protein product [Heterobilharzia americana]|nr:unnamed protein product [Heterobilharzia americana]CAH8583083.1 unnamed protein product [Heterobilharzia americana]
MKNGNCYAYFYRVETFSLFPTWNTLLCINISSMLQKVLPNYLLPTEPCEVSYYPNTYGSSAVWFVVKFHTNSLRKSMEYAKCTVEQTKVNLENVIKNAEKHGHLLDSFESEHLIYKHILSDVRSSCISWT